MKTRNLLPVNYSSEDGYSTFGRVWVGYRFGIAGVNLQVTGLYGGTTCIYNHRYYTAVYSCSGNTPTALLGWIRGPNEVRRGLVELHTPIELSIGSQYIMAIGSCQCTQRHANFAHFVISPIDTGTLLSSEPHINFWEPSSGNALRWGTSSQGDGVGDYTYIVGKSPTSTDSDETIPDIGMSYRYTDTGMWAMQNNVWRAIK